jgi:putative ABC transport system permease protein
LIAAGLLIRSFAKMRDVSWGFDPSHVVTARIGFTDEAYRPDSAKIGFYRNLLQRLQNYPGFGPVGAKLDRIGETWIHQPMIPEGSAFTDFSQAPIANYHIVSPDYFRSLGIPMIQGRGFDVTDDEKGRRVAIVDADLAKKYFPNGDAIGRRLSLTWYGQDFSAEIVGIVAVVKNDGVESTGRLDLYVPFPQQPVNTLFVDTRTSMDLPSFVQALKQVLREIDPGLPVSLAARMEDVVAGPSNARRFPLGLLSVFSTFAMVLAAIGIYAVTAHGVSQRTREIGVRVALGATSTGIARLVLRDGFRPIIAGLVVGLAGGVAAALTMQKMLFGIAPLDMFTFGVIPVVLVVVALLACWLPTRRATKVDPVEALRAE